MGGGGGGGGEDGSLEDTPTWAVATVCFGLVFISIIMEHAIHLLDKWLKKHKKRALSEALEKIKSELILLGFISLLLTVGESLITGICLPKNVGDSWHPCKPKHDSTDQQEVPPDSSSRNDTMRRLLQGSGSVTTTSGSIRRVLSGGGTNKCLEKNKVPIVSSDGIYQLHILIFVLAIFHLLYCMSTMALGGLKVRRWKSWEVETTTAEYELSQDPNRFRFARETSFGRRHLNFWSKSPILIWIVCFFRQFVTSVPKVDYLTLRHGFVMAHLTPQSSKNFNFLNYIKRSLEEDFKIVVGISPPIWFFAVLFVLFNTRGWYSYLWLPFIPLVILLLVGTKLQVVILRMALKIMEHGDVVKGAPTVHPKDELFWFKRPKLILYLIHFVLFQNAFQVAFLAWSWFEYGFFSCFHRRLEDIIIRISMGILIQVLCSYVTLPLYALVTQMGSSMKSVIFTDRVVTALRKWHQTARKHLKENQLSGNATPLSISRPTTPKGGFSPQHLLQNKRSDAESPKYYSMHSNLDIKPFNLNLHQEIMEHGAIGMQELDRQESNGSIQLKPMDDFNPPPRIRVSNDFTFPLR